MRIKTKSLAAGLFLFMALVIWFHLEISSSEIRSVRRAIGFEGFRPAHQFLLW